MNDDGFMIFRDVDGKLKFSSEAQPTVHPITWTITFPSEWKEEQKDELP